MKQLQSKRKMVYRIWPLLAFWEVPAYLEQMEKKGLRFERMCRWPLFAAFSRILPENIETVPEASKQAEGAEPSAYCWDYFPSNKMTEIEDYLEICRGGGWEIVWQFGRHKVFRAEDGKHPAPMQEEEVLKKSMKKNVARWELLWGMFYLLGFLWLLLSGKWKGTDVLSCFPIMLSTEQLFMVTAALFLAGGAARYLWRGLQGLSISRQPDIYSQILRPLSLAGIRGRTLGRLLLMGLPVAWFTSLFLLAAGGESMVARSVTWIPLLWMPMLANNSHESMPWEGWNKENYPKKQNMKGTLPPLPKAHLVIFLLLLTLPVGGMYLAEDRQPPDQHSRNLYCNEIYTDTRGSNLHNTYYHVRNERDVPKIVNGIFTGEWVKRDEEAKTAIKKGDEERLFDAVQDEGMRELLESKPWDELYDGGAFCLIVRRGNEVWRVFNFVEPDSLGPMEFLQKTGF